MAYVSVYGTMWDDCSNNVAHTSSMSGNVKRVSGEVNTHFGKAMHFSVASDGTIDKVDEHYINEKIRHWESKGNKKKIEHWKERLVSAMKENRLRESKESVDVNFNPTWIDKSRIYVSGIQVTEGNLRLLSMITREKWKDVLDYIEETTGSDIVSLACSEKV